jgi:hypothetical protein
MKLGKKTHAVTDKVFEAVYDTPGSLFGRHKWLISHDQEGRKIDEFRGMPHETFGAPPWVSGDRNRCSKFPWGINRLNIVSLALWQVQVWQTTAQRDSRSLKAGQRGGSTRHRQLKVLQTPKFGLRRIGVAANDSINGEALILQKQIIFMG